MSDNPLPPLPNIEAEKAELENLPKVPIQQYQSGQSQRCSFCGRASVDLVYVETVNGMERFKCMVCGQRHL
jgi:transcription elongation factor Elf1